MSNSFICCRRALLVASLWLTAAGCDSIPISSRLARINTGRPVVPNAVAEFTSVEKWKARSVAQLGKNTPSSPIQTVQWVSETKIDNGPADGPKILNIEPADSPPPARIVEVIPIDAEALPPVQEIDFKSALQWAGGQNPRVAVAAARVDAAFAELEAAQVLWLPTIRAGLSVNKHEGTLQETGGRVFDVSRTSLLTGLGVMAVGAGTPMVPGISARFHVADAVFQPRIAAEGLAARQSAASAVTNDLLLETSLAYLNLLFAVQQQAIADETVKNASELVKLTTTFAKSGQGPQADADRAEAELSVRKNEVARAEEAVKIASARLAELLRLDPTVAMQPVEPNVVEIDLVSLERPVQELVATGLSNRPELAQSRQLVGEALQRLKREKYAPFLPSVLLGVSYGGFGGAPGGSIDNYRDRFDLDALAFWEVRNLGFGEKAVRDAARSQLTEAKMRELQVLDRVAREIAEAFAQVQARKAQITTAQSGITAAKASYQHNLERIRNAKGLPIELLQSIQALDQVRREYLRAVTEYNQAQFRLYRAIGWPAQQEFMSNSHWSKEQTVVPLTDDAGISG